MKTTIKSQAYNDWIISNTKLAGIILNFIEKVKMGSRYFDKYKGYEIQLTDDSKLLLIGDIVQSVVSSNNYGYDWYNHKRGILKVFNIEKRKYESVEEVAMKPIPSWFNKMCEVLADR